MKIKYCLVIVESKHCSYDEPDQDQDQDFKLSRSTFGFDPRTWCNKLLAHVWKPSIDKQSATAHNKLLSLQH